MTQDQYHEAMKAHPDEAPVLAPRPAPGWHPPSAPSLEGYDAEDLGVVIAEAVGSANDVDGVCWTLVGKLVIEALTGRK